ncbi:MAG: DNA-formamidopyrimidine glycosylase family protein [Angustibacter sp.]
MPEGDVVWRTADRLHRALAGRLLVTCDLRWPSLATVDLSGRRVREVVARGKHLLMRCDGTPPVTLHSHLRMDGSWHVHRTELDGSTQQHGSTRQRENTRQRGNTQQRGQAQQLDDTRQQRTSVRRSSRVRAVLANEEWTAVGYALGMLDVVSTANEGALVGHLGPDLLGPDWSLPDALARLGRIGDRPIGDALLDQRNLAGIGTFYLAETLFLRGIHPWTPVSLVPDVEGAVLLARRLLLAGTQRAVQSTTGSTRYGETSWVYGRARQPCRRCGTPIQVGRIGAPPHDRIAFSCTCCQLS